MSRRRKRPPAPVQAVNQLRVHRVEPGTSWSVRILSEAYGGCLTHWWKGRGVYCEGEACLRSYHVTPSIWKGYCAAEVYYQAVKKWGPVTLEITESLELDFRGRFARGQIWQLSRKPEEFNTREPVVGELLEPGDPDQVPPEFDYRPPLLTIYNLTKIDLSAVNPKPAKVFLPLSDGPPPLRRSDVRQKPAEPRQVDQEAWEAFRHRMGLNGAHDRKPPLAEK